MGPEQNPVVRQVVRYGLPAVVLIYYVTASLGFGYTPDSTFHALHHSRMILEGNGFQSDTFGVGTPSPLWVMLVALGGVLQLDVILAAKVLGLFFSCGAILFMYLFAHEVLADRVMAFCGALMLAMQSWFLQTGPSGSAFSLGLLLTLMCLFFLLRNEYVLAAVLSGLATLVFWEAVGLIAVALVDAIMNSIDKRRGVNVVLSLLLVYVSVLLPWLLWSSFVSLQPIPWLIPTGNFSEIKLVTSIGIVGTVALMVGAFFPAGKRREQRPLRSDAAPLLWIVWSVAAGFLTSSDLWLMALPVMCVYALVGLKNIVLAAQKESLMHAFALGLAAVLLIQHQIVFYTETRNVMEESIEESRQLMSIAYWLKANTLKGESVSAEESGILQFVTDYDVQTYTKRDTNTSSLIVTSQKEVSGYKVVFDPAELPADLGASPQKSIVVWRKE